MSTDTPTVRDVRVQREWPPVEVVEREENRSEHAWMAVVCGLATVLAVWPGGIPTAFAAAPAFVAGVAAERWQSFPDLHNGGDR